MVVRVRAKRHDSRCEVWSVESEVEMRVTRWNFAMENENVALKIAFSIETLLVFYKILALERLEILQNTAPKNGTGPKHFPPGPNIFHET